MGILLFVIGIVAHVLTRSRYSFLLFLSGIGAGIFIGALWSYAIVMNLHP